jgi:hypothetical protein
VTVYLEAQFQPILIVVDSEGQWKHSSLIS